MTEQSQQTASSAPPVPTLSFKPGKTGATSGEEKSDDSRGKKGKPEKSSGQPRQKNWERQSREVDEARTKFQRKRYKMLSTIARDSIQKALAELSYSRRKLNLPCSIKHFIEQALLEWCKSPRSRINFAPKVVDVIEPSEKDPRKTFNNEIEEDLKDAISDICHERKKVGHPVKTMITILDDAFCQWLPKQEDLPQEYIEAVLQVSQESGSVVE